MLIWALHVLTLVSTLELQINWTIEVELYQMTQQMQMVLFKMHFKVVYGAYYIEYIIFKNN